MNLRCILCVLSGSLLAGLVLSFMAASQGAEEPGGDKKPEEKTDRSKKILEALGKPNPNPMEKPAVDPKVKKPRNGKNAPMAPAQPMELTPAQRVQQLLTAADADGSGTLSRQEVGAMIDSLGPAGQQIGPRMAELFRRLDRNRDNQLTPQEATAGMQDIVALFVLGEKGERGGRRPDGNQVNPAILAMAQGIVAKLDRNKDGKITEQEAGNDKDVAPRFAMADTDQDKQLTVEEVYAFLQKALPMLRADNK